MARYELKNDVISIEIDSHGAELKSLKKLESDTEYMWCADAKCNSVRLIILYNKRIMVKQIFRNCKFSVI